MTPREHEQKQQRAWTQGVARRGFIVFTIAIVVGAASWWGVEQLAPQQAPTNPAGIQPSVALEQDVTGPSILQVSAPTKTDQLTQSQTEVAHWASTLSGPLDIPARALVGYANAELVLRAEQPNCHLSWVTLAGIGKASSDHGRSQGAQLNAEGIETPPLADNQNSGHTVRSGPMQLSLTQWNSRGTTPTDNIQAIDDAAIAAGRTLCAKSIDLSSGDAWWKTLLTFGDSELFRQQVLGNAQLYATLSLAPTKSTSPAIQATRFALSQLGLPYVWGGNGPDAGAAGFDCSGLTKASYDSAGVALPRTADSQFRAIKPVTQAELGDLVFYGNPATRIHHVGLYLGNGLMINAPSQGQAVQIHTYHLPGDDYVGAGRPS